MDPATLSTIALGGTFLWLLAFALWAVRRLIRRDQNPLLWALLLFFLLYGVSAGLDAVLGVPSYRKFPGYYKSSHDPLTLIVSCGYLCLVPLCWLFFCRRPVAPLPLEARTPGRLKLTQRLGLHCVILAPLGALLLAPDPRAYRIYGVAARGLLTPRQFEYHHLLAALCTLCVLGIGGLLSDQRRLVSLQSVYLTLVGFAAIWIHGKRNVVALVAFVVGYQLWQRGWLKPKRILPALLTAAILLTAYAQGYQAIVRSDFAPVYSAAQRLENSRLDFCRDHVLRLVIHSELRSHDRVLEYRGQSFLFTATMLVPRRVWPEKPLPYSQYVVSAAFGVSPRAWGWGHPSSILDETIANLGWAGFFLGPLLVAGIAMLGARSKTLRTRSLTAVVVVLILEVQLMAFTPVVAVWACLLLADARKHRASARRQSPR